MITKIAEIDLVGAVKGLLLALATVITWVFLRVNKQLNRNDKQTTKNASDIRELQHDIKDIKKSLDGISKSLSKLDSYSCILNTIIKRFDNLEIKIDNKR